MSSSLQSDIDLPVIDISQFPSDFDGEGLNCLLNNPGLAAVREACKEAGFFYIGNHGIPVDLLQQVEFQSRQLCSLPTEAKEKAVVGESLKSYHRRPTAEVFSMLNLPESDSIKELSNSILPQEGRSMFSETFGTYSLLLAELARKISKIILASLGLDVENFYHSHFEKCTATLRINHYFPGGKSLDEEILFAHTDVGCLTILYQSDNDGGLQIRSKEGEWLNVKPLSHSFVVNVGDSLKAWSNGLYRSAEHRVVYKGWVERFSVPYFFRFPEDKEIWAPDELVEDQHPRRYRPLIFSQFEKDYLNHIKLKEGKSSAFFERYANIKAAV